MTFGLCSHQSTSLTNNLIYLKKYSNHQVFPKTMQMNDFPVETFRCQKMKKSKKKAVEKPITVHLPGCAMKKLLAGESPGASLISIASNVASITADILPKLPILPAKNIPKTKINELGIMADLDSPSLSDTQIEPPRPKPIGEEEIGLIDLDSFKLTQEELEMLGKGEGEGGEGLPIAGEGEGAELESYFALTQRNQVRSGSLAACFISAQINTDVSYKYKILPALEIPPKIRREEERPPLNAQCQKRAYDNKRNYRDMAEDCQVLVGENSIYDLVEDDETADKIAPYVAIMAVTLAQEFPPSRWHSRCLDYILKSGQELYDQHQDYYHNIEEFKIKFIRNEYTVATENIFDTYLGKDMLNSFQGHKTLENYLSTELFGVGNYGILITPNYVAVMMLFNNLYYMYLPYMCTVEGEAVEEGGDGYASCQRFKSLEPLILKFLHNRAIHMGENVSEYMRLLIVKPTIIRTETPKSAKKKDAQSEEEIAITQSKELAKESNFVTLPDDSEIVRGSTNVADYGDDVEYIAPFVCIMAAVVGKKYNVLTWSSEVVDFVLKCGAELYKESNVRFDQVPKLDIPKISLGQTEFTVTVSYLYDGPSKQKLIEAVLSKVLYQDCEWGILVTQNYSCAVYFNNYLYYLFECFGCNEVGLGEGIENKGVGCINRFKDITSMASRIVYNKKKREVPEKLDYIKFVMSVCKVKRIYKPPPKKKRIEEEIAEMEVGEEEDMYEDEEGEEGGQGPEEKKKDEPKMNRVGYQWKQKRWFLEGDKVLSNRDEVTTGLKEDHFVCLCACLMVINHPIRKWDTRRVNTVMDMGKHVFSHAKNKEISPKRTVRNILVGQYFFDVMIRRIIIPTWRNNRNIDVGLNTVMAKRKFCILQFPNCSYVVYKEEDAYHLFDPYGPPPPKTKKKQNEEEKDEAPKAGWLMFKNDKKMKRHIVTHMRKGSESYTFYTFDVLNIKKASKKVLEAYNLALHERIKEKGKELSGKPFYECESWLDIHQSPWSRVQDETASGEKRGEPDSMWHNWDIEYPRDLYSLVGNLHQIAKKFKTKTRGKQTLANLVVAIGMTNVYDFPEWNSHVMDSILINGDNYFKECIKDIDEKNYEISMDDLKPDCSIFPYNFQVNFAPVVQGTMFLENVKKFNLYKALKSFFDNYESRCGIISATKGESKKFVAFGKTQEAEYFMFDCSAYGPPMFKEREGAAYILRCLSVNRLLHCIVLTLKGGEFFIYDVEAYNFQPVKEE